MRLRGARLACYVLVALPLPITRSNSFFFFLRGTRSISYAMSIEQFGPKQTAPWRKPLPQPTTRGARGGLAAGREHAWRAVRRRVEWARLLEDGQGRWTRWKLSVSHLSGCSARHSYLPGVVTGLSPCPSLAWCSIKCTLFAECHRGKRRFCAQSFSFVAYSSVCQSALYQINAFC
jgi:hypothetical protein